MNKRMMNSWVKTAIGKNKKKNKYPWKFGYFHLLVPSAGNFKTVQTFTEYKMFSFFILEFTLPFYAFEFKMNE
mgnify:CR=1 FL=1